MNVGQVIEMLQEIHPLQPVDVRHDFDVTEYTVDAADGVTVLVVTGWVYDRD